METPRRPGKPPLPPDIREVRQDSETMERELIFGMVKSYRFYREAREIICTRDPNTGFFRRDFTVHRYNELFQIVDHFWRAFERNPPANDMFIPPLQLAA